MDWTDIAKTGIIGGIAALVIEFIVGLAGTTIAYWFGFIAMLVGGFIAGWMIMGKKMEDAAVAGVLAGLIYVVFGLFIIYPAITSYRSADPIGALVFGIILGAIGGAIGTAVNSSKSSGGSKRKR